MPVEITEAFLFEELGRAAAAQKALERENSRLRAENAQLSAFINQAQARPAESDEAPPPKVARK